MSYRRSHLESVSWIPGIGAALAACSVPAALANPTGLSVLSGSAQVQSTGPDLTLRVSDNSFLSWNSFHIGVGESVRFVQPSATSVVWNQIGGGDPSAIFGSLNANGTVVLINPAGFHFGPGARVDAANLVISTAVATPVDSGGGPFWSFNGAPPSAAIVNYGRLSVAQGGSLFLIGNRIENHGSLDAHQGDVGLLSAQQVLLSARPDGRGLASEVRLPSGAVENTGRITADAGLIALHARVVNQGGELQADSIREVGGRIELIASEAVNLGGTSRISANGDAVQDSRGGDVVIHAGRVFSDASGSQLAIRGGGSGDGGQVEICAPEIAAVHSRIDGTAAAGRGGALTIDPQDIVLGYAGGGSAGGGTVVPTDPPAAGTLNLNVSSAFVGLSHIRLQASRNIQLAAGTVWNLADSTGVSAPGSLLELEAGNNITLANGSRLEAGTGWSVSLSAGRDFSTAAGIRPGIGNIALNGSAGIQGTDGFIRLQAGNNVTVAGGFVRTTGGGDIDVRAVSGNINTGTKANGFLFRPDGYGVDPDLGGIATAAGGSVSLVAGQDIISFLPLAGGLQTDAGSGGFGTELGNVTVRAGRDVQGHFVVRNGLGVVEAGRNAGSPTRLLALSLVSGSWDVRAGADILLQEVRNPNGLFNNLGASTAPFRHWFDYADDASVSLAAGNSVQLRGSALPRYADSFSQGMTPIYPGNLIIRAGAGGVALGNDVTLFPSSLGNLDVVTTAGGSVVGTKAGDLTQWIVSDAGGRQYRRFGSFGIDDHANEPVHGNDSNPVRIDVAGDLRSLLIAVPKRAQIDVGGSMVNSRFEGQNLRGTDVTRIRVAGDILNRNEFTTVALAGRPDFTPFDLGWIFPVPTGGLAGVERLFTYDPKAQAVTFQGRMTGEQLNHLLNLPVQVFDTAGQPVFLPNGDPVTRTIEWLPRSVLQALYDQSQDVPLNADTGYRLGGGGRFEVTARNLDLGATAGIVSFGPRANPALARIFTRGADLDVQLTGDLGMFSSAIATLNGGDIRVVAGGSVAVGSKTFTPAAATARGIFTTDRSDVTVIARGDIDVNGSRIAAYDGGDVRVLSMEGNVDAGSGASGAATVEKIYVDPVTRRILSYAPTIPGSGILATTFPPSLDPAFPVSQASVGDITVDTPQGSILANSGGIVQIPLNGQGATLGTVTLRAGSRDAAGNVIHEGGIDASGSGVIGSTVKLEATGSIRGLVFARENIDIAASQSVNVTALAQGSVNVSAGGSVSGTFIGIGSVNASGSTVDASLLSQNVSASGNVSSGQVGFAQGSAASGATQGSAQQAEDTAKTVAKGRGDEDNRNTRMAATPRLTRTVGRVTVILPKP